MALLSLDIPDHRLREQHWRIDPLLQRALHGFGYNLAAYHGKYRRLGLYQDIIVHAYRKD